MFNATRAGIRRRNAIGILAAALLVLVGCSGQPEEPATEIVEVPPEVVVAKAAPPEPAAVIGWPLTGVPGEVVERPAMSIKIENSNASRPQTGLQAADVVWEQMVEGGITRFNAVYHSTLPAEVGPVRSVRPMDAGISAPYGGLIVFSGGQSPFVQAVRDAGLQVLSHDGGQAGFYRTPDRFAPHNLYGTPQEFLDQADDSHSAPPPEQFAFARTAEAASAVTAGTAAGSIAVHFPQAHPGWTWDAGQGLWLRTEDGAPATTSDTGQLTAVNVVVLRVDVVTTSYTDPSGASVPETVMAGSGEAVVATGGRTITGTWTKPDDASPVTLTTADGAVIRLAPGNTWVELLPTSTGSISIG
ncbi:DUF3048 domain-containing protein [Occultella glacieicola]|uniref:DUF3048 domain-containing protein n=1 Tax=Occultella glacieicola TaxID=2518684 RepID=A0ABY2E1A1_9MICO|nr:DUF3048 domain-containing protein [Occultella glacieicola]TDE91703.1 DUF3048 domain-containing protein [Occultella glacieicola]